jgi:hypothetical protein
MAITSFPEQPEEAPNPKLKVPMKLHPPSSKTSGDLRAVGTTRSGSRTGVLEIWSLELLRNFEL